jgi:hypothetical protein
MTLLYRCEAIAYLSRPESHPDRVITTRLVYVPCRISGRGLHLGRDVSDTVGMALLERELSLREVLALVLLEGFRLVTETRHPVANNLST